MKYSKVNKFKRILLDLLHKLTINTIEFLIVHGTEKIPAGHQFDMPDEDLNPALETIKYFQKISLLDKS